jgi:hypothetical protein
MDQPKVLLLSAALLACGCEMGVIGSSPCEASTNSSSSCLEMETCLGRCVPLPLLGWSLPVLLWSGPELEAPDCPADQAGVVQYEGYAEPGEAPECHSCSCEPPTGECELPSFLFASSQPCGITDPAPVFYDFSGLDADPMSCNTDNPIPAGLLKSVTFGPLTMIESGCKPVTMLLPRDGAGPSKTFARACGYGPSPPCGDPGAFCASTAASPLGFSQCIFQQGEHECPSSYPIRRVFYAEVSDSRSCSECWCGPPEGGECSSYVRAYEDAMCSSGVAGRSVRQNVACQDSTSIAIAGKTATTPIYEPGACEPLGGELVGSVELDGSSTFCCL